MASGRRKERVGGKLASRKESLQKDGGEKHGEENRKTVGKVRVMCKRILGRRRGKRGWHVGGGKRGCRERGGRDRRW